MVNPSPSSLQDIGNSKISVEIAPMKVEMLLLHYIMGSISSPVYWSWHIWVTDSPVESYTYLTETPIAVTNYVNYVNKADAVLQTTFMDRNLGATDAFPNVANPQAPTTDELLKIRASTGLHYQWGRKDPIPAFQYADNRSFTMCFWEP